MDRGRWGVQATKSLETVAEGRKALETVAEGGKALETVAKGGRRWITGNEIGYTECMK